EANAFLTGSSPPPSRNDAPPSSETIRYYGIQRGRKPGVYTNWTEAQKQIQGFTRPRYMKFSTREEAEEFVRKGREQGSSFATDSTPVQKLPGAPGMVDGIPKDEL